MNIIIFLKVFLRVFSDFIVLNRKTIALLNSPALDNDVILRINHFLGPSPVTCIVAQGFILKRLKTTELFIALPGVAWRFIVAVLTCKVASLGDSSFLRFLQTFLPRKFFVVDWRGRFRSSSWRWLELGIPSRRDLLVASHRPLPKSPFKRQEAVIILGTGPSAELVFSEATKDFDIISCNSAVKSRELFMTRNVVAHCFSDATFMLGVSTYSSKFFSTLLQRSHEVPFSIVYDAYFTNHLQSRLGADFAGQLLPIFLDSCNDKQPNFRSTCRHFSYTNVLTALMLPLAATWYQRIYLLGFDGKGATKDYFWKHQDHFQFTELLPTVRECDPGFFARVDYDAYSAEHERYLFEMLDKVKQSGVIVRSLTRSSSACIDGLFDHDMSRHLQEGYRKTIEKKG